MNALNFDRLIQQYAALPWNIKEITYDSDISASNMTQLMRYCETHNPSIAGFLAIALHQLEDASRIFTALLDHNSQDERAQLGLATVYTLQNKFPQAIPYYEQILFRNHHQTAAMIGLASIYTRTKHYVRAEQLLITALTEDPANLDAKLELATVYLKLEKQESAIALLKQTLSSPDGMPNYAPAWINLARLFETTSQNPEAEQAYLKALELRPHDTVLYGWLYAFFLKTGQEKKARALDRKFHASSN